jgi:non-lysosomal glucosylceramidase
MPSPTPRQRKVYRGEALRAVAMPLGGVGTGTIALCGDGSLRQWQVHNQVNHLACVPHSFFAVWARPVGSAGTPVARVLQSSAFYDTEGPLPPPTSNDHLVPSAHRALLKRVPGVETIEFIGEYPIAELTYYDPALPLQVAMEAFSPFVPLESKDSGLPVIVFSITITNPTDRAIRASVAATLQNVVGWDGVTPISDTECAVYEGNINMLVRLDDVTAVNMDTARLSEEDAGYGSMVLAVLSPEATYRTQWDDLDDLWADFSSDGQLSNATDATPSPVGRTWNGALAVPSSLDPGESRTVTFVIAWHFPNRYVNWSQRRFFGIEDGKSKFWLGNQYNNWFKSALDVMDYVQAHFERLAGQTRLTRDTFYDTTLPYPLIDAVTSQASIIRTPTCFWTEGGLFCGFEGCCGASTSHCTQGGCCPLNCTHVWNYEMALARLFPALERTMRETEWDIQQHPSGYLPHRVALPTYLPRPWDREIGGPDRPALDGLLGSILKTYREYRACGDAEWLAHVWPSVKQALQYVWTAHDPGRSGVIDGEQPNTYDISIYGVNTFIGTLYLAALRAVETMAGLRGEGDLATECREIYRRGQKALEERLWNGEYYVQDVDLEKYPEQNWATGCHSDQLLGQWWAHVLGLGHVLDADRVRTAALSIFRRNFREDFHDHKQQPRAFVTDDDQGLLNCTWPGNDRPEVPTQYSDEVWTGIEYEVAGLLLYEGEVEPALRIVEAVRTRYDGRKQSPWNDIECGDHYVRAMASWALLEAASGYRYEAGRAEIGFAPVLAPEEYRAPFVARDGWGTFAQYVTDRTQVETITPVWGSLAVKVLCFQPWGVAQTALVTVDGQAVSATLSQAGGKATITLAEPIILRAGQALVVTLCRT